MSSNFDDVRSRVVPQRQHSTEEVQKLFGKKADTRLATQVIRTNRAYYESVRRQAIADGILDAPREHWMAAHYKNQAAKNAPRVLSESQVRAVAQFSREECERLLLKRADDPGAENMNSLRRNDPARYEVFRTACVAHGLLRERAARPEKPKTLLEQLTEPDGMVAVGDALRAKLNLPEGYRVPAEQLSRLVEIAAEVDLAKQKAVEPSEGVSHAS